MVKTLTNLASFLRPLAGGTDVLVAAKLHLLSNTVAEFRHNSNVIYTNSIAIASLPLPYGQSRLQRQYDTIASSLRAMRLMALGERTANMNEMLTLIARYCDKKSTTVVDGLSTIIEPLMIVFVGLMIGVEVVALPLLIFCAGYAIR